jgi:hypothetical protein
MEKSGEEDCAKSLDCEKYYRNIRIEYSIRSKVKGLRGL